MSVLYEMGLADRIPKVTLQAMVAALKRQYLPYFSSSDVRAGRDPVRDTFCHCALGNIFQFMSAAGVDMDETLPWASAGRGVEMKRFAQLPFIRSALLRQTNVAIIQYCDRKRPIVT